MTAKREPIVSVGLNGGLGNQIFQYAAGRPAAPAPPRGWNVYTQVGFHFDPAFEALRAPIHLDGYFQSELYFREVVDELRDLFKIRVPTSPDYDAARAQIRAADWPV